MNKRLKDRIVEEIYKEEVIPLIEGEVYLVGGFIRDIIIGKKTKDIDFVVRGSGLKKAKELTDILKKKGVEVNFVVLDEKEDVGRVIYKDKYYDFSSLKEENIESNLKSRDFTINALALSLKDKVLYDVCGGLEDIEEKKIELISEDAVKKDPVRLLRAIRFSAELDFNISSSTLELIKKNASFIKDAPGERVQEELFLTLKTDKAAKLFLLAKELTISIFPELKGIEDHSLITLQNIEILLSSGRQEIYLLFPKYYEKIIEYIEEEVTKDKNRTSYLKLASLLHDIGKPLTYKEEKNKVTFIAHDRVGAALTKGIAKRLRLPSKGEDFLVFLVANHMWPGYLSVVEDLTDRAVSRFIRRCKENSLALILLFLADRKATGIKWSKKTKEYTRRIVDKYFYVPPLKIRLVSGYDIMETYNLKPSPIIGRLLKLIEEAQEQQKIKTKEEALELIKPVVDSYLSLSSSTEEPT